ncbi:MAG: hypothetical protein M3548_22840 [Actinomycetota bacterium]|nr:hypothetical protein [Actinomycetota bacterium]
MTMIIGPALDMTENYDTCGYCTNTGHPEDTTEPCPICRGCGLSRLCPTCLGVGHHPDSENTACWTCDGAGEVA